MSGVNWRDIRPMPIATHRKGWVKTWPEQRDEWEGLSKAPLIVTAQMVTPVVHGVDTLTHLDALLSWAALTAHPSPSKWDGQMTLPLPLDLLWVSPEGLPLWAATPLVPAAEAAKGAEYWHKRTPSHRADLGTKMNAVTTAGRWKEYRVPLQTQSVDRLHALCIGHPDEIKRLLDIVTHIGKKGAAGYGRVAQWSVTPTDACLDEILVRRSVPVEYYDGGLPTSGKIKTNDAWTPPYWYAPWHRPCVVPR